MTQSTDLEYHLLREKQERALANEATDPEIAAIHDELADGYMDLAADGRKQPRLTLKLT